MSAPAPTHHICVTCSTAVPATWTWRRWDEQPVCISCLLDATEGGDGSDLVLDVILRELDGDHPGFTAALTSSHMAFHRGLFVPWCPICKHGGGEVFV